MAVSPAPERPYSAPPTRGVGPGPLAFRCFDLADGDPELALLLAVTAVRLGYELLPDDCHPAADPAPVAASSADRPRDD